MKLILSFILILVACPLKAQDGSDMHYYDIKKIDTFLIGKFVHLDFGDRSFGGGKLDTIQIAFKGFDEFKEVRRDNGFNNWFSQQYLESVQTIDGLRLRIQKMKLLDISEDSLKVKLFGHYFNNEEEVYSRFLTDTYSFSKTDIKIVLVHAKAPIRSGLSIYRVYEDSSEITQQKSQKCLSCFEANEDNLFSYPLINNWEIEKFDFVEQRIFLTEGAQKQIERLDIPLEGLPVVMTLNNEIIYEFWLWNEFSSFSCDRVYAFPKKDFVLKFGLPKSNAFGKDPRFDKRLSEYFKKE